MSDETRLDDLLRRWEELRERGESPTPEEICRDDPDLLGTFRQEVEGLLMAERALRTGPALSPTPDDSPMPIVQPDSPLEPGAEPVPGYRLVAPLGEGGFGEVWKAEGPGGFLLALKFVRLTGKVGAAELRALEMLKGIRHPNLLSPVGAWHVGSRLVVAMELADRTLGDRLREAQAAGLIGIPGSELLELFGEAAKGIDFLNAPRHTVGGKTGLRLQHRDIKPANILLVGNGVKVADFGLVRLLEHTQASHTGALTPAYAAPEFFAGQTSPHSDQYSLAVTYCQLRGGRLPFTGSMEELMSGHLRSSPDLTMLPPAERPAVGRALAKRPADRWPGCRALVEALAQSQAAGSTTGARLPRPGAETIHPTRAAIRPPKGDDARHTRVETRRTRVETVPMEDVEPCLEPRVEKPATTSATRRPGRILLALGLLALVAVLAYLVRDPRRRSLRRTDPRPAPLGMPRTKHPIASEAEGVARSDERRSRHVPSAVNTSAHRAGPTRSARNNTAAGPKPASIVRFDRHQGAVQCVSWSPGNPLIYSAGDDGIVWPWDPRTGEPSRPIKGHNGPVRGLAVSPDGRYLLTGGEDETVRCWDLKNNGQEMWKKATHASGVFCVAIAPDGQWGISSGQDRTIRRWRLADGQEVKSYETEVSYFSLSLTSDGRHALAAGDSPVVISLDFETGEATRRCTHRDVAWGVACAAKSDWAVSGGGDSARSKDYLARVWNAADGRPRCTLEGHRGAVGAVAISPDGNRVLSGSADHTVRLWDARTGQALQVFTEHQAHVSGLGFSPDGNRAVSVGLDGSAFVWPLIEAPD